MKNLFFVPLILASVVAGSRRGRQWKYLIFMEFTATVKVR